MTCDGSGRLPCRCIAARYNSAAPSVPAPCSCPRECPGCPECKPADDAAERAARHAELTAWYEGKVGTAPPRAKAAKGEAKAKDDQGRLFV